MLFVIGCQKVDEQLNPKTQTSKVPRGNKSGAIRSKVTLAPEDIRASAPTHEIEELHRTGNSLYKVVLRYNQSEGKPYDLTTTLLEGDPIVCNDCSGYEVNMTIKDFWGSIMNCVHTPGTAEEFAGCVIKVIKKAVSDCVNLGGSHCWMY
jgi:hypothetical protein